MWDAHYGTVFSLAIDAFIDKIGFDTDYRETTSCTVYQLEDHKIYLKEVHEGDALEVETYVLDVDEKRFLLRSVMRSSGVEVCLGDFLQMHVSQVPEPHATPMPSSICQELQALMSETDLAAREKRVSRELRLKRT